VKPQTRTDEHVGEWRVTISADTLEDVFAEMARSIARTGGRATGDYGDWEPVRVSAADVATLAADWANELIGRSEIAHRAYDQVRVTHLDDRELQAEVRGRAVDMWRSPLKAATYHGLRLERARGAQRWRLTVLMDV
jgi:SHS2 domain-containing protein